MGKNKEKGFSIDLNEIMEFPKEGIFSRVISKSKSYSCTLMCLSKGSEIDTHTSTKSGFVHVIKGRGVFSLFGAKIAMKPGVFISMPANAPHSLKAEEDLAILLYLN